MGSQARSEIAIGVIGSRELVERIMTVAGRVGRQDWRLLGAAYAKEEEAYEKLLKIESVIDVCLFAGPLSYELAREHGELPVPATYVPRSGSALYSTLLRAAIDDRCDPARVSIDSLARAEVDEAYTDLGVSVEHVHVYEYRRPESAKKFFAFHEKLYRDGATSGALTTVPTVAQRLTAAGIPTLRMTPASATLRNALNTAALLGMGTKMEESQIAIMIVEIEASARPGYSGPSNYRQQELKLSVHQALLQDARRMGATVIPRDENSYLIVATLGSVTQATAGLRSAPFMERVQRELGVAVEVGIGLGRTARDAEVHAQAAVEQARATDRSAAVLVGADQNVFSLPSQLHRRAAEPGRVDEATPVGETKNAEVVERLHVLLGDESGDPLVVDAAGVAEALSVTSRTASRLLRTLADEGLAWRMPPARAGRAGRPRQLYRLVTEKLGDDPGLRELGR